LGEVSLNTDLTMKLKVVGSHFKIHSGFVLYSRIDFIKEIKEMLFTFILISECESKYVCGNKH